MTKGEASKNREDILVESERLLIQRIEAGDAPILERIFCDPEMMRYLGDAWTPEQTAGALKEWHEDWGSNNRWYGLLIRKDTLEPIGTAGVTEDTIPDEQGFELSWFVLPEHQGQGFATEITSALLRFVFNDLEAKRVVAETHPENPASNRVLEKLHFECLGERHHKYDYLPEFETQVLWALSREQWQQKAT